MFEFVRPGLCYGPGFFRYSFIYVGLGFRLALLEQFEWPGRDIFANENIRDYKQVLKT